MFFLSPGTIVLGEKIYKIRGFRLTFFAILLDLIVESITIRIRKNLKFERRCCVIMASGKLCSIKKFTRAISARVTLSCSELIEKMSVHL